MRPLLLLLCVYSVWGRSTDQKILLAQGQAAVVYTDEMLKSTSVPLAFTGAGGSVVDWRIATRGQERLLRVSNTPSGALVLGPDESNPLGGRWRYTAVTNYSLLLSNNRRTWSPRAKLTSFYCSPSSPYFCALGASSDGYEVVLDLAHGRGALPPALYYSLTQPGAGCSDVLTMPICPSDIAPHFSMNINAEEIRMGSSYWRTRYAQFEIDGWTGVVVASLANPVPEGYQTAGQILGILVMVILYGVCFATNPLAPSYSTEILSKDEPGRINKRISIGSYVVLPCAVVGILLAWIADAGYGPPDPVLLGPELQTFLILLTVYVIAQIVLLVVLIALDEFCVGLGKGSASWSYSTTRDRAWLRSLALGTSIAATATLFFYPAVVDADAAGDRLILWILIIPLGITIVHGWYHLPRLFIPLDEPAWAMYTAGAYQFVVVGGWMASIWWFFLQPTIGVSSAYFDASIDLLSGVLLTLLATALTIFLVALESEAAFTRRLWPTPPAPAPGTKSL